MGPMENIESLQQEFRTRLDALAESARLQNRFSLLRALDILETSIIGASTAEILREESRIRIQLSLIETILFFPIGEA